MRTSKLWKTLVGIAAGILVILLLAEFGLRWYVGKQLGDQMHTSSTGQKATVSFGSSPLLVGLAQGSLGYVEVDSPSTVTITAGQAGQAPTVSGQPESHVVMKDVQLSGGNDATAGSVDMVTTLRDEYLLAVVQRQMADNQAAGAANVAPAEGGLDIGALAGQFLQQLVTVTDITSNPANGTIDVQITNGAAALSLRPQAENGSFSFVAENASLFGVSMPTEVTTALTQGLNNGINNIGEGLQVESITVVDGGVKVHIVGTNVPMSSLEKAEQAPIN